jgi:hypothetical protein
MQPSYLLLPCIKGSSLLAWLSKSKSAITVDYSFRVSNLSPHS